MGTMRSVMVSLLTGAVAVGAPLAGQTLPATEVQQAFDQAAAIDVTVDPAAALAAWEALEARTTRNKRSYAIVLIRKSYALLRLGRRDEAFAAARAGIAELPTTDATLRGDRATGYLNLAAIAADTLDYASAAGFYARAEELADNSIDRFSALLGLIETQTFVDPPAAGAAVTRAETMLTTNTAAPRVQARLLDLKARALLNRGDFTGARDQAKMAVKLLGGLTSKTDLLDVSARSDVAIASLLAGKSDEARQYMAMTGAGRLPKGSFDPGAQMTVPDCGGEAGLKPADMAVIEFSVGDDGAILSAQPIYAAGGGAVALEFARAARDWSWSSEQVKQLPPFFRYNSRVELRCSTAYERPSISDLLETATTDWLESKGVAPEPEDSGAAAVLVTRQRARLAAVEAEKGTTSLAIAPALGRLLGNVVLPREERHALATRMVAILDANQAPPAVRLGYDLAARTSASAEAAEPRRHADALDAMLAAAPYAGEALSRSALRLFIADGHWQRARDRARMRALLRQTIDEPVLAANDPLRVGALIRLASLEQDDGNVVAARQAFDRSGLEASQCALLDSQPRALRYGGAFPQEAMAWGFEGWTQTQFDINGDGKVINERAVLSYPPFIFSKAGKETVAGTRFAKTYRPDGGLGCGGTTRRIKFLMPD